MYQTVKQSRAEKVKMYMRVNKRKLVDMLIACNDAIDSVQKDVFYTLDTAEAGRTSPNRPQPKIDKRLNAENRHSFVKN